MGKNPCYKDPESSGRKYCTRLPSEAPWSTRAVGGINIFKGFSEDLQRKPLNQITIDPVPERSRNAVTRDSRTRRYFNKTNFKSACPGKV